MSEVTAPEVLIKQPSEVVTYSMDYKNLLAAGETISSVSGVTTDPSGPTIGTPAADGTSTKVNFSITGGTDGTTYRIEATVVTTSSNTRICDGILKVKDK